MIAQIGSDPPDNNIIESQEAKNLILSIYY